jgi:hypothetical protein
MALKQSKQVVAGYPSPTPREAANLINITAEYTTVTGDAINDIVEMGAIPEGCVPVDLIVDNGALGADATADAGIISGEYGKKDNARTMGNEFFAAKAVATAGVVRRDKNVNAVLASDSLRGWGIKFLGANPAAGQTVRATLVVVPAPVSM